MRTRLRVAVPAAVAFAALAGLGSVTAVTPALAQQAAGASSALAAFPAGSGPPPPGGGGTYAHSVYSQISIGGQPGGGGSATVNTSQYTGPPCWIEPRFPGSNSWHAGDPVAYTPGGDADEYWWWFSLREPQFAPTAHSPWASRQINDSFRRVQAHDPSGWWWVPAWLQTSGGMACALGLVSSLGLNNGFLQYTPPQVPADSNNPGPINPLILREMARAALTLPPFRILTNPAPAHGDVNLPVWVWVRYAGNPVQSRTASVRLPNGTLMWATVTASAPRLSIAVNTGSAVRYGNCGEAGHPYPGDPTAVPRCGVTFLAPSTGGPFTLTVTAQWQVTWRDYTGARGTFPPAQETRARLMTVREIQSINTAAPTP